MSTILVFNEFPVSTLKNSDDLHLFEDSVKFYPNIWKYKMYLMAGVETLYQLGFVIQDDLLKQIYVCLSVCK